MSERLSFAKSSEGDSSSGCDLSGRDSTEFASNVRGYAQFAIDDSGLIEMAAGAVSPFHEPVPRHFQYVHGEAIRG